MNCLGGGLGFRFWSELIYTITKHIRDVGDCGTIKSQMSEGVGAECCGVEDVKGATFNIIFLCVLFKSVLPDTVVDLKYWSFAAH